MRWLCAAPAVLFAALILGTTAWASVESSHEQSDRYRALAKQYAAANEHDKATMCYERLLQLSHPNAELLFGLAQSLEAQGQTDRAAAIVADIAPLDKKGYSPAHVWWARRLLSQPRPTPTMAKAAEVHLLRALEGQPDDPGAVNVLLGELLLTTGQLDRAREYLAKAPNSAPAQLRILQIEVLKGQADGIKGRADVLARFFQERTEQEPLAEDARLYWAETVMLLKDHAGALAILRDGIDTLPDSPRLRRARTTTYLNWLDALDRDPNASPADRLTVLGRAMTDDPADETLLRRLWGLASAKGPDADKAIALLRVQLVEGTNAGLAHLALGTIAWDNGRADEARVHLEQAYRAGPHVPVVGNNLAWMLAHSEPPQYDRALEMIDRVVAAHPNVSRFRGTRGHVLAKMKRWKDAVPDLEAALAADPQNTALHAALAEAYSTLGDPVLSSLHKNWKSLPAEPATRAKPRPRSAPW